MDNNFSALLLSSGLRERPDGVDVLVRLPWYRALPASVVEVANLSVNGAPVALEQVTLEINGKAMRLADLKDAVGEFWFVLDDGVLHVPGHLASDGRYDVELQLNLYPPYIPHLTWVTRARRTMAAGAMA